MKTIKHEVIQLWNDEGQLIREEWRVDGKFHRVDGPAVHRWNDEGQLILEEWRVDGKLVVKPSGCDGKLVTIDGKQYRLESV